MQTIHVVEPTLVDEAGHCAARFLDLVSAAPDLHFTLWADRRVKASLFDGMKVTVKPYFIRQIRKFQMLWLYRQLLRTPGVIYVPTSGYIDMKLLDLMGGRDIPQGKVLLYFHKLNVSAKRAARLKTLAGRQGGWTIFATTDEIAGALHTAGWPGVRVALPEPVALQASAATGFRHLLFAGSARADKGFDRIVALAEALAASADADTAALVVQASGDHYGRFDDATAVQVARLAKVDSPRVTVISQPLSQSGYAQLFDGSICLQPYCPEEYTDKVSGITLDALRVGSPIVATAGTWMARIIEKNGGGIILDSVEVPAILDAVRRIRADYAGYSQTARLASARLSAESGLLPLVETLRSFAAR